MRVKKIEFSGFGVEALKTIIKAFAGAFPSLDGIEAHAKDFIGLAFDGVLSTECADRIRATIQAASCGGEWPAEVEIVETTTRQITIWSRRSPRLERVVLIRPYSSACGSAPNRIMQIGGGIVEDDLQWTAIADYSGRPSDHAASPVLELVRMEGMIKQPDDGSFVASTCATSNIPRVKTWKVVPAGRRHKRSRVS